MKKKKENLTTKTAKMFNFLVNFALGLGVVWVIVWLIKQIIKLLYFI